ncbi:MAG: cold-shock protein [Candidatus Lambdaproteobacteria bacterium RIFOXYD12_FULL_49_8]|uniref:Cold-shock protein n=1 Tax=Candidatus Lambdaproteobacteria bacterium RIFOXYD2_FULL_50_16 TaxID=1817772 RepID=A0A1F6GBL7_9PROT|nr:MAG: cold-shock protein [Candidatus Lambdaproteobacteria bacterium RIFOXYD2_FULL_50_16]OGG97541.1 MAG: cold-shock protein [Candidatus Lambdaproteobacteria bacterium RIFOXYD12_FULL_49_8]
MEQGKVKWYNVKKGYGFIVQPNGRDLFVHKSGLGKGTRLQEAMLVEYEITEGARGPCASEVKAV